MTVDNESSNRWWEIVNKQLNSRKNRDESEQLPWMTNPIIDAIFQLMSQQRIMVYGLNDQLELMYLEGAVEEITGYPKDEFITRGMPWRELVFPEDLAKYNEHHRLAARNSSIADSYRIITKAGLVCWLNEMTIRLSAPVNGITMQGIMVDVTEQKQSEHKYLQRQAQLDSILNSAQDVIWSVMPDTFELSYVNPATQKVYGYPQDELLAGKYPLFQATQAAMILENFTELLYKGEFETEYSYTKPDGEACWLHKRAYFARDAYGVVARIDGIDTDITIRKKAEDAMRYMSEHDALTTLYNRAFFEKQMQRLEIEKERLVGLIICDVDGLKLVNDNWGHEAGDKLLMQCASILKACFPHNTIARIGGDEFAVIMENHIFEEVASAVTSINRALLIYNRKQTGLPVSLSVGWSIRSASCSRMHEVFREADNRMYAGKPANRLKFIRLFEELNKST
ncbi:MAG: diguanylate cyclase domain-containing protein [Methylocystaceae bacterium]